MMTEPNNASPHTQNTIGKQPKPKKLTNPKATRVMCNPTTPHPHKEKNKETVRQINIKAT